MAGPGMTDDSQHGVSPWHDCWFTVSLLTSFNALPIRLMMTADGNNMHVHYSFNVSRHLGVSAVTRHPATRCSRREHLMETPLHEHLARAPCSCDECSCSFLRPACRWGMLSIYHHLPLSSPTYHHVS